MSTGTLTRSRSMPLVTNLETVVDAVGIERFPLLGISQGGDVAVAYAVQRPERVLAPYFVRRVALGGKKRSPAKRRARCDDDLDAARMGRGRSNISANVHRAFHPGSDAVSRTNISTTATEDDFSECAVRYFDAVNDFDIIDLLFSKVKATTLVSARAGRPMVPLRSRAPLAAASRRPLHRLASVRNHLFLEHEPARVDSRGDRVFF